MLSLLKVANPQPNLLMRTLPLTLENLKAYFPGPASLCYIGDPCYVIHDDLWGSVCDTFYDTPADKEAVERCLDRMCADFATEKSKGLISADLTQEQWLEHARARAECQAQNGPRFAPFILFLAEDLPIIIASTNYGDGSYPIQHTLNGVTADYTFGVDAGLYSIIPLPTLLKLCPHGAQKDHNWLVPRYSPELIPLGTLVELELSSTHTITTPLRGDLTLTGDHSSLSIQTSFVPEADGDDIDWSDEDES
jgi:hypothetical protein